MDTLSLLTKAEKKVIIRLIILFGLEMVLAGYTIASAVFVILSDGHLNAGYAVIPSLFTCIVSSIISVYINKHVRKRSDNK